MQSNKPTLTDIYNYDQANRLIAINADVTYTYNGAGLRMSKSVGGNIPRRFAWDMAQTLPLLLADGETQFIYGPNGRPLEQVGADGRVLWFHQDQLGSTRALTNNSGKKLVSYRYSAFGQRLPRTPGKEPATPLLFAGQYTDAESGFQYLRARYYDPATGQFLTRDPLASITRQPYLYANGDPVNRTDPTGKEQVVIVVNTGTQTTGTNQSIPNDTGAALVENTLVNGATQAPGVGVYNAPGSPEANACVEEGNLSLAGMTSPETSVNPNPYGGNPITYAVTQNVHVSGSATNPNSVHIVTTQVADPQGNIVYQNQVTGTVADSNAALVLQQQGGANVNAFIQGVTNQNQGTGK
jgi:RHS repeat-associated protein